MMGKRGNKKGVFYLLQKTYIRYLNEILLEGRFSLEIKNIYREGKTDCI